jgi:serine/threonine protein kinase
LASGFSDADNPSQFVLIEGCWHASLEALVLKGGLRRDPEELLEMAAQLFNGLSVMHKNNIRHTDLKLDNCGYNYDGNKRVYKIGDFGCMSASPNVLPIGSLAGTKRTIAPERLETPPRIGLPSDVWALAVTIIAACTGRYWFMPVSMPHAAERADRGNELIWQMEEEIRSDIYGAAARFREQVESEIPIVLGELLLPCLQPDQERATAAETAIAFDDELRSLRGRSISEQRSISCLWKQFEDVKFLRDSDKMQALRESTAEFHRFVPNSLLL